MAQTPVKILVHDEALKQTKNIVYLGSTITGNARLDSELTFWMGRQAQLMESCERCWGTTIMCLCGWNTSCTKRLPFLLRFFEAETWTVYRTQVNKLNAYIMQHLREIMKITWKDRVSNDENTEEVVWQAPTADILIEWMDMNRPRPLDECRETT